VPSLGHDFYPYTWGIYVPSLVDTTIVIGSFAWFFILFLGFIKLMPSLSVVEVKETIPAPMKEHAHAGHPSADPRPLPPRGPDRPCPRGAEVQGLPRPHRVHACAGARDRGRPRARPSGEPRAALHAHRRSHRDGVGLLPHHLVGHAVGPRHRRQAHRVDPAVRRDRVRAHDSLRRYRDAPPHGHPGSAASFPAVAPLP